MRNSYSRQLFSPDSIVPRLAVLDMCPYYDLGNIITRINVPSPFRRQGVGKALLQEACDDADAHDIDLFIEVASYGEPDGMDNDQLRAWYAKFGFVGPVGGVLRRKYVSGDTKCILCAAGLPRTFKPIAAEIDPRTGFRTGRAISLSPSTVGKLRELAERGKDANIEILSGYKPPR